MATEYKIALHRFDVNLLPADARQVGTERFKTAVILHFAMEYAAQGQTALVIVDEDQITVMAFPAEATALEFVLPMLKAGRISEAVPYLESLAHSAPANAHVLYNLGISYNELGQFDEAIIRLKRAVQLDPGHAHAWVGIGNAYHRMRKPEQALEAFEKAVQADPEDGYTRRNLGGMLIMFKRTGEAVAHLRKALVLLPDDPQSIFGLATALEDIGTDEADQEADALYKRFIAEHPNATMVELAEKSRTAFAHKRLKAGAPDGLRRDVMLFIEGATLAHHTGDRDAKRAEVAAALAAFDEEFLEPSIARRRAALAAVAAGDLDEDGLPRDVLTVLLRNQDDLDLAPDVVLRETCFYLLAGAHTSATAFVRTLHSVFGLDRSSPADAERARHDLAFLQRCVHETIRLQPSSPVAMRWALEPMELQGGEVVAAGDKVVIDLMAANRDPSAYGPHADDFDPHRELPPGVAPWGLSFGLGMHACIGQELAAGSDRGTAGDDLEPLYGLVPVAAQALLQAGARPDPGEPARLDPTSARDYWATYPVLL